jgi:tetratricopeptide (TPR) repeat protein
VAPPAKPVLDQLAAASSPAARKQAIEALAALDPVPVAELAEFLARKRTSSEAERRALLAARGFDVPDEKGRFRAPGRQADKEEKANDQLDWLATLVEQPASPALTDVLGDIAAIRALAAGKQSSGAAAILKFAFQAEGVAYRDECGRFLRRMSPWSLPALIRAAEMPSDRAADKSRARYARYQLERLDRENPRKALSDAPTDELQVEILRTFADSQYREAVFVVLDNVDHVSPKVRKAARDAWTEYATGRPPRPAPKEKLLLPGGKQTEEEVPLWLDHRELADIAIRRRLEELTGKKPPTRAKLAELSAQLFQVHDRRQAARLDKALAAGLAEASAGKLPEATQRFDAILVQAPDYARRAQMAEIYLRHGEVLEKADKHREAATAFGKAHAVAPEGPIADQALANHHRARGHGLAAEGKKEVAAAALERATEIDQKVDRRVEEAGRGDRKWMLIVGIVSGLGGIMLLAMGLAWRRRAQWRAWRG